jgi:hypothetical protein
MERFFLGEGVAGWRRECPSRPRRPCPLHFGRGSRWAGGASVLRGRDGHAPFILGEGVAGWAARVSFTAETAMPPSFWARESLGGRRECPSRPRRPCPLHFGRGSRWVGGASVLHGRDGHAPFILGEGVAGWAARVSFTAETAMPPSFWARESLGGRRECPSRPRRPCPLHFGRGSRWVGGASVLHGRDGRAPFILGEGVAGWAARVSFTAETAMPPSFWARESLGGGASVLHGRDGHAPFILGEGVAGWAARVSFTAETAMPPSFWARESLGGGASVLHGRDGHAPFILGEGVAGWAARVSFTAETAMPPSFWARESLGGRRECPSRPRRPCPFHFCGGGYFPRRWVSTRGPGRSSGRPRGSTNSSASSS